MYKFNRWYSATAVSIALLLNATGTAPIAIPASAIAQTTLPVEITGRIPAGTAIPVKYQAAQKIIVAPEEPGPIPLTLVVAQNIVSDRATFSIPAGTQVVGELVTMQEIESAQFVAKQLILKDGKTISINASSRIISKTQEFTDHPRVSRTIANTALGTAAAAAIAAVTGNPAIASQQILLSSGFGSTPELIGRFRNQQRVRLLSIEPETDLTLTLNSDLILRRSASQS
ncbi:MULTISPECIES: hypothetical protein [Aerosakkonema]|uniref:hypothetical protein n=1 Tax=Aerosakkonema TaxID=1246629 RepID=UPI0035BA8EC7